MITEDYVSYETAKLLKEKGFDWECKTVKFYPEPDYDQESPDGVYAPTIQMALKWLREKDIHILFEITQIQKNPKYYCVIWNTSTVKSYIIDLYDSYEEASDDVIKYCLENLI